MLPFPTTSQVSPAGMGQGHPVETFLGKWPWTQAIDKAAEVWFIIRVSPLFNGQGNQCPDSEMTHQGHKPSDGHNWDLEHCLLLALGKHGASAIQLVAASILAPNFSGPLSSKTGSSFSDNIKRHERATTSPSQDARPQGRQLCPASQTRRRQRVLLLELPPLHPALRAQQKMPKPECATQSRATTLGASGGFSSLCTRER